MKIKSQPYIIAEIGINFDGRFQKALRLINDAKKAGVDAVKFQLFKPETLANFNIATAKRKELKLFKMWKKMSLNYDKVQKLKKFAKDKKLDFILSVFDIDSLKIAEKIGVDALKIASSDINDHNLLREIKRVKKAKILSTGMASKKEIKKSIKILGHKNLYLLHCVSMYPCDYSFANLNKIQNLRKITKNVGYSDHTIGIDACLTAVTMNACIIEKHFTNDKKIKGGDHLLSADLNDMKKIVTFKENYKKILGNGALQPTKKELENSKNYRKGIYYLSNLKAGDLINNKNIVCRRPKKNGLDASKFNYLIGKKLKIDVKERKIVKLNDFVKY